MVSLLSGLIPKTALSYPLLSTDAYIYISNPTLGGAAFHTDYYLDSTTSSMSGSYGYGSYDFSITPTPTLSLTFSSPSLGYATWGSASILYYYEVIGPTNTMVPIYFNYSVSLYNSSPLFYYMGTGVKGGARATLSTNNYQPIDQFNIGEYNSGSYTTGELNFTNEATLYVPSNSIQWIDLLIQVANTSTGYVSASIDPSITIDSSYVAQGYTLIESPGVGNYSPAPVATPEPATILLMSIGIAGGAFMRKKQKSSL